MPSIIDKQTINCFTITKLKYLLKFFGLIRDLPIKKYLIDKDSNQNTSNIQHNSIGLMGKLLKISNLSITKHLLSPIYSTDL